MYLIEKRVFVFCCWSEAAGFPHSLFSMTRYQKEGAIPGLILVSTKTLGLECDLCFDMCCQCYSVIKTISKDGPNSIPSCYIWAFWENSFCLFIRLGSLQLNYFMLHNLRPSSVSTAWSSNEVVELWGFFESSVKPQIRSEGTSESAQEALTSFINFTY